MKEWEKLALAVGLICVLLALFAVLSGILSILVLWALNKLGILHVPWSYGNCIAVWVLLFTAMCIFSKSHSNVETEQGKKR